MEWRLIFFWQHDSQHGCWVVTRSAQAFQPDTRDMFILIRDVNAEMDL